MKVYEMIYSIQGKDSKVKIFNPSFIRKNKNKFKIIHKGKLYPMQSEFIISDNNIEKFNIKLVSFYNKIPDNIFNRVDSLLEIYSYKKSKTKSENYIDIIKSHVKMSKIKYNIKPQEKKIKIFGKNFVDKNKDKCKIIYQEQIFPLKEYFLIEDIKKDKEYKLDIYLIELEDISDKSYMFDQCKLLEEYFDDFKNKNENLNFVDKKNTELHPNNEINNDTEENIIEKYGYPRKLNSFLEEFIKMDEYLFFGQTFSFEESTFYPEQYKNKETDKESYSFNNSLSYQNNRINISINNYEDFLNYTSFSNNVSKIDSQQLTGIKNLFNGCSSLRLITGIDEWNTEHVESMYSIFKGCSSLKSLPDISKWNTKNVDNISQMFEGCESIEYLPDISKWNTENIIDMSYLLNGCSSLKSLPDISKWNTKSIRDMFLLFKYNFELAALPEYSKWKNNNANGIHYMFRNCSSLKSLPDISG